MKHRGKTRELSRRRETAFTLVEILAAVTLVMLLMVVAMTMMNSTRAITATSRKNINSDAEARMILDRIAGDIGRMLKREDLDYLVRKQNGNDSFFFYSEAPAFSADPVDTSKNSPVSLVGYRVDGTGKLERLGKGLTWDAAPSVVFVTYASFPVTSSSVPVAGSTISDAFSAEVDSSSGDPTYHVLGANVFRLEIGFLLKATTNSSGNPLPAIFSNLPYDTRVGHSSLAGIGLGDVQSIVITIAILDEDSRKILPVSMDFSSAVSALPDSTDSQLSNPSPELPATTWQNIVDSGGFAQSSGMPAAAAKNVRVYQRIYPIGAN